MARIFQLTNGGAQTVDLINPGATGFMPSRGGFGDSVYAPELDLSGGRRGGAGLSGKRLGPVTERWKINVKGSSHDNLASQINTLVDLLIRAEQFHLDATQLTPVYLKVQTSGEANPRYALVYGSPELRHKDPFDFPFEVISQIAEGGLSIVREALWRDNPPGVLPSGEGGTVIGATDGPASPRQVHLANFRDTFNITHIKNFDFSLGTFSANLYPGPAITLFPAATAIDDYVVFSSTAGPFKHVVLNLGTAGIFTAGLIVEYVNSATPTWAALAAGTGYLMFPDQTTFLKATGHVVLSIKPPSDWVSATLDTVAGWHLRIRLNPFTSMGTRPANATDTPYAQRTPEVRITGAAIGGVTNPLALVRMAAPSGGGSTPGHGTPSKIIAGLKTRGLASFVSHLNLGNAGNPAGWANTYGADASSVADPQGPAGVRCDVSFATDPSEVLRVRLTGTGKLADWVGGGEGKPGYRSMGRLQQVGGAVGDCKVKLRIRINGVNDYDPKIDLPFTAVALAGVSIAYELTEFGASTIPFAQVGKLDNMGVDVIFDILASRVAGSTATLRLYDLINIPADELIFELQDPLSDSVNGSSALRGNTSLEVDGGLILDRTVKYVRSAANNYLAETWTRRGEPFTFVPGRDGRIYFLIANYATQWGAGPMVAPLGAHLDFKLWLHFTYPLLRGAA